MSQEYGHHFVLLCSVLLCSALAPFQGCSRQSGSGSQQMLNSGKVYLQVPCELAKTAALSFSLWATGCTGLSAVSFWKLISSRTSRESLLSRWKLVLDSMTLTVVGAHPHRLSCTSQQVCPFKGIRTWGISELSQVFHISLYVFTSSYLSWSPSCRTKATTSL